MTVHADLEKLRQKNKELEELIKAETTKLSDQQSQQKELRAQMASLEKLANRLTTSQSTLATHLEAAQKASAEAEKFLKPLLTNLTRELPPEIQTQIEEGIKASDEEIQTAREQVDAQKKKIADAENALVVAQNQFKESQATTDTLLKQLQYLPQTVKDAQARVSKLFTETRNSSTTGQTRKSYYLAVTLKRELEQLNSLVKAQQAQEKEVLNQINQLQNASKQAQKAVEDGTADLAGLKADLLTKEQDLKQKEQQREGQLKELLTPTLAAPGASESKKSS